MREGWPGTGQVHAAEGINGRRGKCLDSCNLLKTYM